MKKEKWKLTKVKAPRAIPFYEKVELLHSQKGLKATIIGRNLTLTKRLTNGPKTLKRSGLKFNTQQVYIKVSYLKLIYMPFVDKVA